jgi:uncharacterized phage protein (TIGR02218 family)
VKTANSALVSMLNGTRKAIQFNGSTGNITVAHSNSLAFGVASFTIEGWITHPSGADNRYLVNKGAGSLLNGFRWGVSSSKPYCVIGDAANYVESTIGSTNIPTTPTHMAIKFDRLANVAAGYLNGVNVGTVNIDTITGNVTTSSNLTIGGTAVYSSGMLDDLRIYARALSDAEIAQHAIGQYQDERGLRLWLPFDEDTGTTLYDLSGNSNNGTMGGTPLPTFVDFNAFLGTEREFRVAALVKLSLLDGTILRYTSSDIDILSGGFTFSSAGPPMKLGKITSKLGVEVSTLELSLYPRPTDLINGISFYQAVQLGYIDGAVIQLEQAFLPMWGNATAGTLIQFGGRISQVSGDRGEVRVTAKSYAELLNMAIPRNFYQPGCLHTLFDSGCSITKGSFAVAGNVSAGATTSNFTCTGDASTKPDGYFDRGTVTFNSGALNGISRTIKSQVGAAITLILPLPSVPATNVTFSAFPGCDKKLSTCIAKFNNQPNFRGFPFVPIPETAV